MTFSLLLPQKNAAFELRCFSVIHHWLLRFTTNWGNILASLSLLLLLFLNKCPTSACWRFWHWDMRLFAVRRRAHCSKDLMMIMFYKIRSCLDLKSHWHTPEEPFPWNYQDQIHTPSLKFQQISTRTNCLKSSPDLNSATGRFMPVWNTLPSSAGEVPTRHLSDGRSVLFLWWNC